MYAAESLETFNQGKDLLFLMRQAGQAIFTAFTRENFDKTKKIIVLCGAGNNGGDGLLVARLLKQAQYQVEAHLVFGVPTSKLGRIMLKEYLDVKGKIINAENKDVEAYKKLLDADIYIDGIFGIGFKGELPENMNSIFEHINTQDVDVYAIDIPSGIEADTGKIATLALQATHTFVIAAYKPAHVSKKIQGYIGELELLDIGIAPDIIASLSEGIYLYTEKRFYEQLKPRSLDSYKGTHGKLLNICGHETMMGAAIIAARAALRAGVGMVYSAVPQQMSQVMFMSVPEAIVVPQAETTNRKEQRQAFEYIQAKIQRMDATLIGCGLDDGIQTLHTIQDIIKNANKALILDATALIAVAAELDFLAHQPHPAHIISPHFGEMARILDIPVHYVKKHQLALAKYVAVKYNLFVVLKGSQTIVATPTGQIFLHMTGNPGLAKAGSGDGLAGTIAAFLAQGYEAVTAANMGVFLHGMAADITAVTHGEYAMLISDVIENYGVVLR